MILGGAEDGYTIVETMVFLVVTAVLFTSAIAAVSGRQATVQFTQGIRDAQSKVQSIINDVSTGYFPSNGSFTCSVALPLTTATNRPTFTAIPAQQGSSDDCIFLGKALQFTSDGTTTGDGAVNYNVLTIAGRRLNSAMPAQEVQSLTEAIPTAVAPTVVGGTPDLTDKSQLQFGIKVTRITIPVNDTTAGPTFGSVIFLSSLPKFSGADSNLASGKQRVSFAAVNATSTAAELTESVYSEASLLNKVNDGNVVLNPQNGIYICLSDQGSKRRAMITIGQGAGQASAKLDVGKYNKVICEG